MKKRIVHMAAAILVAAIVLSSGILAAPAVSAKSAVLMDADTGRVIWQQCGQEKALIASTTKIMTCLLIVEECSLQDVVCVPEEAVGIEGSSIHLREGEELTVEALLYGMMLHSGNDAAVALALHHSGSVQNFANHMNEKAKELGLQRTKYRNPHGLDEDEHYSTALDLAKLTAHAMSNDIFREIVASKTACFGERSFTNHNKMLWKYNGAIGVKTGYTKAAGRILVSCARQGARELICVTISAPNDWNDHCDLFDYGFKAFQNKKLLNSGTFKLIVPVVHGGSSAAGIGISEDFSYSVADAECVQIDCYVPNYAIAPVIAGEVAGEARIIIDEKVVARVPLLWLETVLERA